MKLVEDRIFEGRIILSFVLHFSSFPISKLIENSSDIIKDIFILTIHILYVILKTSQIQTF